MRPRSRRTPPSHPLREQFSRELNANHAPITLGCPSTRRSYSDGSLGMDCPSEFSWPIFQRLATDSRRIRGRFGTKQTRCRREGKSREGYSPRVFRELSVAALRDFTDAKTRLCAKNGK